MICNPLDKCCEIVSSNCVAFIGHLPKETTLCLADNSLTTFLLETDISLTDLSKGSYILKSKLDNANICVPKKIIDTADLTLKQKVCNKVVSEYYYTSDVVVGLIENNCVLQTRLNLIYTEVNNPSKPQVKGKLTEDFMNFELPDSYKDMFRCLYCEDPCVSQSVETIGDLLQIMAKKIIAIQQKLPLEFSTCKECP